MNKKIYTLYVLLYIFILNAIFSQNSSTITLDKNLQILNSSNANWTNVLSGKVICSPVITTYGTVTLTEGKIISATSFNGNKLWEKSIKNKPGNSPLLSVISEDFLILITNKKNISLINPSGLTLWTVSSQFEITDIPLNGRDKRFFVKGNNFISCYGLNGICKWTQEIKDQNKNIPLLELNDGSVISILSKTENSKSKAIRISPFGKIIETITFAGEVISAKTTQNGILLAFSNGGMGLCSVKDNNTISKWVISSNDNMFYETISNKNATFVNLENNKSMLLIKSTNGTKFITFNNTSGKLLNSFIINDIDINNKTCIESSPFNNAVFISDKTNAILVTQTASILFNKKLPLQNTYNYICYTPTNHIVIFGTDWVINGYRTVQKLSSSNSQIKKTKLNYNDYYKIDTTFYDVFEFSEKIDSKKADPKRTKLLIDGKYGILEEYWGSIILSAVKAYENSLQKNTISSMRTEKSIFQKDVEGTALFIKQLSLLGTDLYSEYISRLIIKEQNLNQKIQLINSVQSFAYDPNHKILESLNITLQSASSKDTRLLIQICDSTYQICSFMGRKALYEYGIQMLTKLLYPQYPTAVKDYARETLKKITTLQL